MEGSKTLLSKTLLSKTITWLGVLHSLNVEKIGHVLLLSGLLLGLRINDTTCRPLLHTGHINQEAESIPRPCAYPCVAFKHDLITSTLILNPKS